MASVTDLTARLSRTKSVAALRIRERQEETERSTLATYATKSADAKRDHPDEPSPTRTVFQVDRDRIVHSKAFRPTKHKTHAFLPPAAAPHPTRLPPLLQANPLS